MAICPAGHQTSSADFCDTCGLPVGPQTTSTTVAPETETLAAQPVICPNCKTPNVAEALFCEACGYDFTTGALPEAPAAAGQSASSSSPDQARDTATADAEIAGPLAAGPAEAAASGAEGSGSAGAEAPESAPEVPVVPLRPVVEWVAELWIDPDWYTAQGSSDPMPSPSLPDIVPLVKASNMIGRVSHSRGIFPDIDCELDTGCSRRHAMLSTDGSRWWIEDLDSANGTFVGAAAGPLPGMPIPQGRVELNPGQRIYVGAWTRIVVRKATDDEKVAFV